MNGKKVDKWEKIDIYGKILTKHNTTVTELIYFWTMSKNRFNRGDMKKKKVLLELSLRELEKEGWLAIMITKNIN